MKTSGLQKILAGIVLAGAATFNSGCGIRGLITHRGKDVGDIKTMDVVNGIAEIIVSPENDQYPTKPLNDQDYNSKSLSEPYKN